MVFCTCPIVKSDKLFIPASFNTIFSSIFKLGFTEFFLIKFRWNCLGLETLIFMAAWSLEADASGSCFMLFGKSVWVFRMLRFLFIWSNITICYNMSWFFTIVAYNFCFCRYFYLVYLIVDLSFHLVCSDLNIVYYLRTYCDLDFLVYYHNFCFSRNY